MLTVYTWDDQGLLSGSVDVAESGSLPRSSTPTKPPKLTGAQVARWVGEGWEKLDEAPEVSHSVEVITATFEQAVQAKLDEAAKASGYDSIFTAISYADEPAVPRFQADGQAFRRWRSLVWDYAHTELNAVLAGEKPQPDMEAFLNGLPPLVLPE